jgi:hypothetical protein
MATSTQSQRQPFGQQLGLMYKRWVLDCIPNLGYAVSLDFSRRPELYKQVDPKTAKLLTDMQSQYGYVPNFPNQDIRLTLMKPVFGISDGHQVSTSNTSAFHNARKSVLAAAAGFAENAQPTAFPMHRERIRSASVPLRRLMEDLEGASLSQSDARIAAVFDTAAAILRDAGVAVVFGVSGEIDDDWPLTSTDAEGAKLIEKITTQLPDMPNGVISRDRFVNLQRIAEKGAVSIFGILETDTEANDDALDQLTAHLYAWGSELKLIGGVRPQ